MKRLAILGSTGSIGTSTLDVVRAHPDRFVVSGLAAGRSAEALHAQISEFSPAVAALADTKAGQGVDWPASTEVAVGREAVIDIAVRDDVDTVVAAIVGAAGLESTLAAIEAGKDVCTGQQRDDGRCRTARLQELRKTARVGDAAAG